MNKRKRSIPAPFAWRTIEMLRSPAFHGLSLSGHRIIARIEIELANHGGNDNGKLPVTYQQFCQFGIDRHSVGPGIRETEALGFTEITQRGRAGKADDCRPNMFRLTYRDAGDNPPTDEWRRIGSVKAAEEIAAKARTSKPKKSYWRTQNFRSRRNGPQWGKIPNPVGETSTGKPESPVGETNTEDPKSPVGETSTTV